MIAEPPDVLIVAVDGLTQNTYSAYRIDASLEKLLAGVRRMAEEKQARGQQLPVLNMRMIATKQNEHEVPLAHDFAAANRFDMLTIRTMSIIDDKDCPLDQFLPEAPVLRAYRYEGGRRLQRKDFMCQNAFAFPTMLLDGSVVPCDQDYNAEHAYGRFGGGTTFREVWYGRRAAEVRRTIRDNPESFSTCRNCPFADRITGTCSVQMHDLRTGAPSWPSRSDPRRKPPEREADLCVFFRTSPLFIFTGGEAGIRTRG